MGYSAAGVVIGALAASQAAKTPDIPKPQEPKRLQEAKSPDVQGVARRTRAGEQQGLGSTFLTGASGVNPNTLNIGGSTLLGG